MRALNHGAGDYGAVLQHILKVDKVAVVHMLSIIIRIVEMDYSLSVSFNNIFRQKNAFAYIA